MDRTKCDILNFDISNLRVKQKELVAQLLTYKKQSKSDMRDLPGARKLREQAMALADEVRKTSYEQEILPVLHESRAFFNECNLSGLSTALPLQLEWTKTLHENYREMKAKGFDSFLVVPGRREQVGLSSADYFKGMVSVHPKNRHYVWSLLEGFSERLKNARLEKLSQSPDDYMARAFMVRVTPYLLFYSSRPIPQLTRDNSLTLRNRFARIKKTFSNNGWRGLHLSEYLMLHGWEFERKRNLDFDNVLNSNGTWLLDEEEENWFVGWQPNNSVLELDKDKRTRHSSDCGVRPIVVVPLDGGIKNLRVAEVPRAPELPKKSGLLAKMSGWRRR